MPRLLSSRCKAQPSADSAYECAAGELGLYGKAFFGHRASPEERRLLHRTWVASMRCCGDARQRKWARRQH